VGFPLRRAALPARCLLHHPIRAAGKQVVLLQAKRMRRASRAMASNALRGRVRILNGVDDPLMPFDGIHSQTLRITDEISLSRLVPHLQGNLSSSITDHLVMVRESPLIQFSLRPKVTPLGWHSGGPDCLDDGKSVPSKIRERGFAQFHGIHPRLSMPSGSHSRPVVTGPPPGSGSVNTCLDDGLAASRRATPLPRLSWSINDSVEIVGLSP